MSRILSVLALAALLPGCALLPQKVQLGGGSTGWGYKTVRGHEEPNMLVAADGTLCPVTPDKYTRTKDGDRTWCSWQRRGIADRPVGGEPGPGVSADFRD